MQELTSDRLVLVPVTLALVEAVFAQQLCEAELILGAKFPLPWPGLSLLEQAFSATLSEIRANPLRRLWGDRIAIAKPGVQDPGAVVVGSVVFHGEPSPEGELEIGYGVLPAAQGKGFAAEAVRAQVAWALALPEVKVVRATTPPWHAASIQVLRKCGLTEVGLIDHEQLGEVLLFEGWERQ
jgi:[ribosomal protein S5]-alanine N-acetyltransferase